MTGLDRLCLSRIHLVQKTNVRGKFLGDRFSRATIGKEFQFRLRRHGARDRSDFLKISVGYGVSNKGRPDARGIQPADIGRGIQVGRRRWRRFAPRLTIKRECLDREFSVISIYCSRAEVRAVEKNLETRRGLDLRRPT